MTALGLVHGIDRQEPTNFECEDSEQAGYRGGVARADDQTGVRESRISDHR